MAIPKTLETYYIQRRLTTLKQADEKKIGVYLYASIRARKFLYTGIEEMPATFGLTTEQPKSKDNPPITPDIITYKNDKAAARSGWLQQIGFTLLKFKAQSEEINKEEPNPNPPTQLYSSETTMYFKLGMPIQAIADKIYATTWQDPEITNVTYKAKAGTVHLIKHRDTTAYI